MAKYLDNNTRTFTPPELYTGSLDISKTWRITWYEMTEPGIWKRARPTGDLNRIPKLKDRLFAGELLCRMIREALTNGWRYFKKGDSKIIEQTNSLITALETHAKGKAAASGSADSGRSYLSSARLFCNWLRASHLDHLQTAELSPLHVQAYIDKLLKEKKSHTTINSEVGRVGTIYERIRKLMRLEHNPFREVEKLTETESNYFELITTPELTTINTALRTAHPQLRLAMLLIYYAYLRPKTIMQLQRKHIDFAKKLVIVPGELHKNRKSTTKQILSPLYAALVALKVDKLPADTYIFSVNLDPGNKPVHRQRLTDAWKEQVIDRLGINKKLYGLKHTGATNFVNDNEGSNMDWLQNQLGHSNLSESAAYVKRNRVVEIDEKKTKVRKL